MTYKATVTGCVCDAASPTWNVTIEYTREGVTVHQETVSVNHDAYPTQAELESELERIAAEQIQRLKDHDQTAQRVVGVVLVQEAA